jgi:hypothetical protein
VHENAEQVSQIIHVFKEAFQTQAFDTLELSLRTIAPEGTTEGSLFVPDDVELLPML